MQCWRNVWTLAEVDHSKQQCRAACTHSNHSISALSCLGSSCLSSPPPSRVPNTDTLHALIREYRDARKIPLNVSWAWLLAC